VRQNKDGEPKLFRLLGHFSIVLLLGTSALNAQSFEDFKRSQAQSFTKYKDERDNAFTKHLKQQWEAYNVYKGTPLYEKPKEVVAVTKDITFDFFGSKLAFDIPIGIKKARFYPQNKEGITNFLCPAFTLSPSIGT
jgi:hypothetical protein